jgi:hypothetical protein
MKHHRSLVTFQINIHWGIHLLNRERFTNEKRKTIAIVIEKYWVHSFTCGIFISTRRRVYGISSNIELGNGSDE